MRSQVRTDGATTTGTAAIDGISLGVGDERRDAERVSRRVDEHPPAIRGWLGLSLASADRQGRSFGTVEVIHGKFQVQLLGDGAIRPVGRLVRLNSLHRHENARAFQRDEFR